MASEASNLPPSWAEYDPEGPSFVLDVQAAAADGVLAVKVSYDEETNNISIAVQQRDMRQG